MLCTVIDSVVGTVTDSVVDAIVGLLHWTVPWNIIVVTDTDVNEFRVDIAVPVEKQSAEDRLGKDVENTVEDCFRVRRDHVTTLAETPGNWVDEPEGDGPNTTYEVSFADIWALRPGVHSSNPGNIVSDAEKGDGSEDKVTPLVGRSNKSTNQTSDNHDFIQKDGIEDGGPRQTSCQEQI